MLSCERLRAVARGTALPGAYLGDAAALCAAFSAIGSPTQQAFDELLVPLRGCPTLFSGKGTSWGVDAAHIYGAWSAERALSSGGGADDEQGASVMRATVEAASTRTLEAGLEGAVLHATVRRAVVWRALRVDTPASSWPGVLWRYADTVLCAFDRHANKTFRREWLVSMCVHGFGHGLFLAAARRAAPDGQLRRHAACAPVAVGSLPLMPFATSRLLAPGAAVCEAAPTLALGYVCATGFYMSVANLVTMRADGGDGDEAAVDGGGDDGGVGRQAAGAHSSSLGGGEAGRFVRQLLGVCDAARFHAACFTFLFKRLVVPGDEPREAMRRLAGLLSVCLAATGSVRSERGCIFGAAAARNSARGLAVFCEALIPPRWPLWSGEERQRFRACVAGAHFGAWHSAGNEGARHGSGCSELRLVLLRRAHTLDPANYSTAAAQLSAAAACKEEEVFCATSEKRSSDGAVAGQWEDDDEEEDEDEDEDEGVGRKGSAPARTPDRQSATWLARTDLRQFPLDVLEP